MPNTKDFKPEILEKLGLLQNKYSDMGQDLSSYLIDHYYILKY